MEIIYSEEQIKRREKNQINKLGKKYLKSPKVLIEMIRAAAAQKALKPSAKIIL